MKTTIIALISIFFIGSCSQLPTADETYNLALDAIEERDYNKALSYLNECIQTDQDFAMAYYRKAIIFRRSQMFEHSLKSINKFLEFDTLLAKGHTERAMLRLALKDYDGAKSDCDHAILSDKKYHKAYYCRGRVEAAKNKNILAIGDYSSALLLNPEYGKAYFYRGESKIKLEDYRAACKDFSKAGELGVFNAFEKIEEYCNRKPKKENVTKTAPVKVVKQESKSVEIEEKEETTSTSDEETIAETKPSIIISDIIYTITSYVASENINADRVISWNSNIISPQELYLFIRKKGNNAFYLQFYLDSEKVYEGTYKFSTLKGGQVYKKLGSDSNEMIRCNNSMKDLLSRNVARDRVIMEIINVDKERAVKLIF